MPTDTPTIELGFALAGDAYVARVRSSADREFMATLILPRAVVDTAVFEAAQARLEVTLDGVVAAYLDTDSRTLSSAKLSELIAAAVCVDALAAEDDPTLIDRLEAELERALEIVRRARI